MRHSVFRVWIEAGLGLATGLLSLLTLLWRDWIELILKVHPDLGNGSVEWAIVGGLATVSVTLLTVARAHWNLDARQLALEGC